MPVSRPEAPEVPEVFRFFGGFYLSEPLYVPIVKEGAGKPRN
jgi:hypothetical protein